MSEALPVSRWERSREMDKNKCTLTNSQLIEKAREWIHSLIDTGGRSWCLRIPADLNHDPDLIFSELCMRIKNQDTIRAEARAEALRDAADRAEEYIKTTLWRDIEYDRENYDIEFDELRAAITQEPKGKNEIII